MNGRDERGVPRRVAALAVGLAVGLAVALAGALAPIAGAALPPAAEHEWVRVDTPHFTLFSEDGADAARHLGVDLERLRSVVTGLSTSAGADSRVPTSIFVFRDQRTFAPYRRLHGPEPADVGGFFVAHDGGHAIAIDGNPRSDPRRVLYHEYLHHVVASRFPEIPLWLNEGLAELYSTFEGEGTVAKLGLPIQEHVDWLRRRGLIPLEELFALDSESPDYHEGSRRGVFYAESWALVHHLLVGSPTRRPQVRHFLELCHGGMPAAEAFSLAFETTPAGLERELRASVRSVVFPILTLEIDAPVASETRVAPLGRAETLYRLGSLLARTAPHLAADAAEHFRAALAVDPRHGPAVAGLGMVAALGGDLVAASSRFHEAAALEPDDAEIQRLLGQSLLDRALGDGGPQTLDPGGETALLLAAARAAFGRVVALAPSDPQGWAGLGMSHSLDRRPPATAVAALEVAVGALPTRLDLAFDLALLYARSGRREDAQRLVDRVLDPADPALAARAREGILQAELLDLEELLAADRLDEALALVERVQAKTTDPAIAAQLVDRAADLRGAIAERDFVDRYNEAASLANSGQWAEASAIAEELVAGATTAEHRRLARELLARLEGGG